MVKKRISMYAKGAAAPTFNKEGSGVGRGKGAEKGSLPREVEGTAAL